MVCYYWFNRSGTPAALKFTVVFVVFILLFEMEAFAGARFRRHWFVIGTSKTLIYLLACDLAIKLWRIEMGYTLGSRQLKAGLRITSPSSRIMEVFGSLSRSLLLRLHRGDG